MKNKVGPWIAIVLGLILTVSFVLYGCSATPLVKPAQSPTQTINGVQGSLTNDTGTLGTTTGAIQHDAATGKTSTPTVAQSVLEPYWTDILIQAGIQNNVIQDLKLQNANLDKATKQCNTLETALTKETQTVTDLTTKLKNEESNAITQHIWILVVLGIVGLAASGWLIFSGSPIGIGVAVVSGILTGVSLFISQTVQYVPYVGVAGLVVICAGFGIWYYIKHKQTNQALTLKNTALQNEKLNLVNIHETEKSAWQDRLSDITKVRDDLINQLSQLKQAGTQIADDLQKRVAVAEDGLKEIGNKAATTDTRVSILSKKHSALESKVKDVEGAANKAQYILEGLSMGVNVSQKKLDAWTARVA